MKKLLQLSLMAAFMLFLVSCGQYKTFTPEELGFSSDTLEMAAQRMQTYIDSGRFAGISVLVLKNSEVVQNRQFGYADIESQVPIKENTIFRIFSMSKPITAVALMTLYDEGKFKLDDKVSDYLPEFEFVMVYSPDASHYLEFQNEEMTIRNLLTHTSGLVYGWDPNSFVDSLYRVNGAGGWDAPIGEKVRQLTELPLKFQPGTKFEYGLSIDVVGYLVEVLAGQPLDIVFKERIFDPLKMDDTGFWVPEEKHPRLSTVYAYNRSENTLDMPAEGMGLNVNEIFKSPATHFAGGAGLVSTTTDYATFCKMLLYGGELDGVRILQEETAMMIMSDQMPEGVEYREGRSYGLAGEVNLTSGEYRWAGAASTSFWIDPSNDMIVVAMAQLMPSNYGYANEYRRLIERAIIKE